MQRLVLALIAAPVLYVLAGFAGALIPGPVADVYGAPTERIGLARGPIHYDILLPLTPETRDAFGFAEGAGLPIHHPQAEWLVIGWVLYHGRRLFRHSSRRLVAGRYRRQRGDAAGSGRRCVGD